MEHDNVWYAFNCDSGEVEKASHKKDEVEDYTQDRDECVVRELDPNAVDEVDIKHDGLVQTVKVWEILNSLDDETDDDATDLDDEPTLDDEKAADEVYEIENCIVDNI